MLAYATVWLCLVFNTKHWKLCNAYYDYANHLTVLLPWTLGLGLLSLLL